MTRDHVQIAMKKSTVFEGQSSRGTTTQTIEKVSIAPRPAKSNTVPTLPPRISSHRSAALQGLLSGAEPDR